MELHLGLTLSSSSSSATSCSAQFDLNYSNNESTDVIHCSNKRKRYDDDIVPQTLSLLVWNNLCNKDNKLNEEHQDHDVDFDGGGDNEVQSNSMFVHYRNDDGVIGWPPVKIYRRKQWQLKIGNKGGGGQDDGGGPRSMYVKVHMEGMGIARKVDLNLQNSYQTLVHTLANMFGKCYEDVKLTYQDKEGDWLLVGDVPWGSFINTIQRLKLLRK